MTIFSLLTDTGFGSQVYMLDLDTPGAKLTIIEPKTKTDDHHYRVRL